MKKVFVTLIVLLTSVHIKAQINIGDSGENVKMTIESMIQMYRRAQGYHQMYMESKVIWDNGNIAEIVLDQENTFDYSLRKNVSLQNRYLMKNGKLYKILTHYYTVTIDELKKNFNSDYTYNSINGYYFNIGYTEQVKVYLSKNKLATIETAAIDFSTLPVEIAKYIKSKKN